METVAVTGADVLLVAVKAGMFPVPLAARPTEVWLLIHAKVEPGIVPGIFRNADMAPLQKV